jgi:hypothetical protein
MEQVLALKSYAEIGFTHALRSLLDRVHTAVRGAASALEQVGAS